jgi:hypothetical protein
MSLGATEWGAIGWQMESVMIAGSEYYRLKSDGEELWAFHHITVVEALSALCPQFEGVPTRVFPPTRVPKEARSHGVLWKSVPRKDLGNLVRFSLTRGIFMNDYHFKWLCDLLGAEVQRKKGRAATKLQLITGVVNHHFKRTSDTAEFKLKVINRLMNARPMCQRARRKVDVLTMAAMEELDPDDKSFFDDSIKLASDNCMNPIMQTRLWACMRRGVSPGIGRQVN